MIAFIFPGQASQTVGMGRALADAFPAARAAFAEADAAFDTTAAAAQGRSLSDIVWHDPSNNGIEIWLMDNTAHWAASAPIGSHPLSSAPVGVGDFNHDAVSDIMWRDIATGHIENWMLAFD